MQDFGEYQESYYSVQTTEGEQISQLIAGYIDIILKKASPQLFNMWIKGTVHPKCLQENIIYISHA